MDRTFYFIQVLQDDILILHGQETIPCALLKEKVQEDACCLDTLFHVLC